MTAPDDTPNDLGSPTLLDRVARYLGKPTEHGTGDPGISAYYPEPTDDGDGNPLVPGQQGVGPATFMMDTESTSYQDVWSERYPMPVPLPVPVAQVPAGALLIRRYFITAGALPVMVAAANPRRLRVRVVVKTANPVQVAGDALSAASGDTSLSCTNAAGDKFDECYTGEVWVGVLTGGSSQTVEIIEHLHTGPVPGYLIENGAGGR